MKRKFFKGLLFVAIAIFMVQASPVMSASSPVALELDMPETAHNGSNFVATVYITNTSSQPLHDVHINGYYWPNLSDLRITTSHASDGGVRQDNGTPFGMTHFVWDTIEPGETVSAWVLLWRDADDNAREYIDFQCRPAGYYSTHVADYISFD